MRAAWGSKHRGAAPACAFAGGVPRRSSESERADPPGSSPSRTRRRRSRVSSPDRRPSTARSKACLARRPPVRAGVPDRGSPYAPDGGSPDDRRVARRRDGSSWPVVLRFKKWEDAGRRYALPRGLRVLFVARCSPVRRVGDHRRVGDSSRDVAPVCEASPCRAGSRFAGATRTSATDADEHSCAPAISVDVGGGDGRIIVRCPCRLNRDASGTRNAWKTIAKPGRMWSASEAHRPLPRSEVSVHRRPASSR